MESQRISDARSRGRSDQAPCTLRWSAMVIAVVSLFGSPAWGTPGDLDSNFGVGGLVTTNFSWSGHDSSGQTMLLQNDGKLIIGGAGWKGDIGFAVVRYNPDGSLDPTFGDTGRVVTVFGRYSTSLVDGVYGLVQQDDGKLVAAGRIDTGLGIEVALTRYDSNGALDGTFGVAGRIETTLSGYDVASALALQDDGRLVVAGSTLNVSDFDILLARYNGDGSLDTSFGNGGHVVLDLGGTEYANALIIQGDGKLVVAGSTDDGHVRQVVLARYDADGTLDLSFGAGGVVTTPVGLGGAEANALVQQRNGMLVACGDVSSSNASQVVLVRYRSDGALDSGFGTNGIVTVPLSGSDDRALAIVQQPDGRLVTAGWLSNSNDRDFVVARYNTDGSIDGTFAGTGNAVTNVAGQEDEAYALVQQPDGKLVLGGVATPGPVREIAVVRYIDDGSLDPDFGVGGRVVTSAGSSDDSASSLTTQGDGKLVLAGVTRSESGADFALARYNGDGSLDSTFGVGGKVTTDVGGTDTSGATGVVQQSSGQLVAGGTVVAGTTTEFALVRYNPDGSLDSSFGVGGEILTQVGAAANYANALLEQRDGKLIVAGSSTNDTHTDFALVRYESDGTLDSTFGSGGRVLTNGMGVAYTLIQQGDGKLVVGGGGSILNGPSFFSIARYNLDGSLDSTFGANGRLFLSGANVPIFYGLLQQPDLKLVGAGGSTVLRFNPDGSFDSLFGFGTTGGPSNQYAIVQQPDGKLLGAGNTLQPSSSVFQFALARYNSNGSLDAGFGDAGRVITGLGRSTRGSSIAAMRLQADRRLVVAGTSDADFAVARYFSQDCGNGVLDSGEQCDDGNVTDGDCCSATCQREADCPRTTPTVTTVATPTATTTVTTTQTLSTTPAPISTPSVTPTITGAQTPTSVTPTPEPTVTSSALDPFTCYTVRATSGSVKFPGIPIPPGVTLVDQFTSSTVEVARPAVLCAPTNKLGEDPTAPTHPEHLTGFQIKRSLPPAVLFTRVVDQFNASGLSLVAKKQTYLLVPTVKNLSTTPPTPAAFLTDHFQCYKVAVTSGTSKFVPVAGVTLVDQFGPMTVLVRKPVFLCNPVDKNSEDPSAPAHAAHLLCYQVKQTDSVKFGRIRTLFVNNQFGPETLDAIKPVQLCVPATTS